MKRVINRLMAKVGYVPGPAKLAPSVSTIKLNFEIHSAPVEAAIARLEQLRAVADTAEVALNSLAELEKLITAELPADETQPLILAELRKQTTLLEVLAKQGDASIHAGLRLDALGRMVAKCNEIRVVNLKGEVETHPTKPEYGGRSADLMRGMQIVTNLSVTELLDLVARSKDERESRRNPPESQMANRAPASVPLPPREPEGPD